MSYGLKYISTAYGLSSVQWKVELYEKDYTPIVGSNPTQLILVGDGIRIGYDRNDDRFNTIYSRYAILDFKATLNFDINTLQFDDEKKYQVKIYKNNSLEFVGWLIPFYSSQEFEDISIAKISVQAKDGINQLKNKKFVDQHPEIGNNRQSQKNIISQCLREIGYNMTLEIYYNRFETSMNKTSNDCPLAQTAFNIYSLEKDETNNLDYYEVLHRILKSHDLRISQAQGVWRIISPSELLDGAVTGRVYDYLGEYVSSETLNTDISFHTGGLKVKSNSIIRKDIPIQQYSAFYEVGVFTNILPNGKLNQFSGTTPVNWTKVGAWGINEVSTILNSNGIQFDNTYTTDEGVGGKYFESSEIDISGLSSFKFTAEAYADSDIDSIKIAIILYNSSNSSYVYYVDKYGSIKDTEVTAIIDKGTQDKYVSYDLSFVTNSATQYLNGVDKIKIRIYPGVRLSNGVPTKKKVKYRNLSLTGQANSYDKEFLGRVYEYKNTNLIGSKVADEYTVYYQDNIGASISKFRNTLFINNSNSITNSWKRTNESVSRTLLESCLVDRLSLTAKFNDIFEGIVKGYIDLTNTLYLTSESKRFIVLFCEYSLQEDSTEVVVVELSSSEISISSKIFDKYENDKIIDVSDGLTSASISGTEVYDKQITSTGGIIYETLYPDGGIDALPIDTTNPRAGNKGILIFGANYAEGIQLGNKNNQTLVEVLGGKLNIGDSKLYSYDITTGDDEVFVGLGIDSHEFQVDGRIMAVGGVEVGQGGVWITKQITPEGLIYGQITAETAITVNSPIVNFPTQIYIKEVGGIGENPVQFNTQVEFNQPIFITESSDPRSAVTKQQLETAVADLTLGEFGQYLNSYDNFTVLNAPYGGSFVGGLLTGLPNGMYLGHSVKFAIGQDKPNEATYMAFGLPRDDFDGKIYLRGIYENGEVDTGWKAVGGDIQNFTIYRNEAEIQRLGYYYEIDKGDQNVFVGFDKTNGDFEIAMMIADSESVIVTEARTVMRAEDGRLCYQFGNNEPVKYALTSEVGTGAAIAYSGQSPISVDGTLIKIQVANGSQNGYLSSADWTRFNNAASGDLNFILNRAIYWRNAGITDPNNYAAKLFWAGTGTPVTTNVFTSVQGLIFEADTTMNLGASGNMNIKGNKIFLNGIEIDMSAFATGKVLKATSSSKAEWVTL